MLAASAGVGERGLNVSLNVQAGVSVVGSRNFVGFGNGNGMGGGEEKGQGQKRSAEVSLLWILEYLEGLHC